MLESRFRVVAPDLRGHGLSSSPPGSYSSHQDAGDLAALARRRGITRAIVFGHSTGGQCAISLAVCQPELVRAVIAVDPSYGIDPAAREAVRQRFEEMNDDNTHRVLLDGSAGFYGEESPPFLRLWHARRLQGIAPWVLRACHHDRALSADQFFFRPETEAMLAKVGCPVLTLRRAGSTIAPGSADWDLAACRHPYSAAITWTGVGHFPHQERPEEFNAVALSWIEGLPN